MILALYRLLTTVAGPLIDLYLLRRLAGGKEDAERFAERAGLAHGPRPEGRLAWVHAASVGESLSVLPLIERVLDEHHDLSVLVTTGTVTSARLLSERLPPRAFHQYVPVDRVRYARRFLAHWRPDLALWLESEFWPNLVTETQNAEVPMVLINGRMSDRSFRRWRRLPSLIQPLLSGFALCFGQTEEDAERLRVLGARRALSVGNIKFATPALPADPAELARLEAAFAERPRWIAASTHSGEEAIAGRVHARLRTEHPGLLTVIVPRHPERGPEIAEELISQGLSVARRGKGEVVTPETDVYLADTLGELGLLYRLCDIVFIGKSLAAGGGQNPLEPARLDCAVIAGPDMSNFADVADRMRAAGALIEVRDANGLAETVGGLLGNQVLRQRYAKAAHGVAAAQAGMIDAMMTELTPLLGTPARERRKGAREEIHARA